MRTSAASEHRLDRLVSRHWWVIQVVGYGDFGFYGTEQEAEEMRAHKSSWEGGAATKRETACDHPLVRQQMNWVQHEIRFGYPRGSEREQAETAAVLAANYR